MKAVKAVGLSLPQPLIAGAGEAIA